jgi:hypothetical protein
MTPSAFHEMRPKTGRHDQPGTDSGTATTPAPGPRAMRRRGFIKTASAGALGLSLPRLLRAAAGSAPGPDAGAAAGDTVSAAPADRPNILWITFEDTSACFLGCYGCKSVRTPNLDRHAAALAPLGQAD